jgi:hypothetical protein
MNSNIYTREHIQRRLACDKKWIERALIVLYESQTRDEQSGEGCFHRNSKGFNLSDCKFLTHCSKWVMTGGSLSEKNLIICKKLLPKYWRQIQNKILVKLEASKY